MSYGDRDASLIPTPGVPILGPAVSKRGPAPPAARLLDAPLPPFMGARTFSRTEPLDAPRPPEPPRPERASEPVEAPTPVEVVEAPAPVEEQEMPPLVDPLDAASPGVGAAPADGEDGERFWGDEVAEPWAELPVSSEPEAVMPAMEPEEIVMHEPTWLDFDVADEMALARDELLAPPAWDYGLDTTAEPRPVAEREPTPGRQSPALEDVAARLEQIARSLRERNPAELLATADDPLQLLIAGYAMGLAARPAAHPDRPANPTP